MLGRTTVPAVEAPGDEARRGALPTEATAHPIDDERSDAPPAYKARIARYALRLAVPLATVMGIADVWRGHYFPAVLEATLAAVALVFAWRLLDPRFDVWRRRTSAALLWLLYCAYAYDAPDRFVHLVWLPLFPLVVVLMASKWEAIVTLAAMVAGHVAIYGGVRLMTGSWPVPPAVLLEATAVTVGATGIAIIFEHVSTGYIRQLRELSETDPLTHVGNRRHFFHMLDVEVARADRTGCLWSILSIDLDHFKSINDGHGHAVGDAVLEATAEHLRHAVRTADVLGRVGGEEFAILAVDTGLAGAETLAARILAAVAASPHPIAGPVTCSIGVTEARAHEPSDDVLRRADAALYAAKQQGRNRIVVIEPPALEPTEPERRAAVDSAPRVASP